MKGVDGGVVAIMMEPILGNGGHIDLPVSFSGASGTSATVTTSF